VLLLILIKEDFLDTLSFRVRIDQVGGAFRWACVEQVGFRLVSSRIWRGRALAFVFNLSIPSSPPLAGG